MRKIFCPTISSVTKTLTDTSLGRPNHIIIHVGTNDMERSSLDSCHTQFQTMIDVVSQRYPSSKVLISSLLKRRDDIDHRRSELNSKLGLLCTPYPNVHLVHNDNIPEDYLHDHKHHKKRRIGALITNLKEVIFNGFQVPRKDTGKIDKMIPPPMQVPFITNINPAQPRSSHAPSPQAPVHQNTPVFPPQMSYAAMTKMPPPQSTHLSQLKHSLINIETVIELLKLSYILFITFSFFRCMLVLFVFCFCFFVFFLIHNWSWSSLLFIIVN